MSGAREEILERIRSALADVPAGEHPDDVPVARDYRRNGEATSQQRIELLAERVRDYHAEVRRVGSEEVAAAVSEACAAWGIDRVVVPPRLPAAWRPERLVVVEDEGLTAQELKDIDGAVTGCAAAIAQTGTLLLDGREASGRRVITLVPDHHICVVTPDQVLESVPEAVTALAPAVLEKTAPITMISGPSASSDIELSRVEGVHGPRHLLVLIAG
ncbi:MAG: LUD domain-containing protein [Solirubrobacteraceae bacterium]